MKETSKFSLALGQVVREHREKRKWTRKQLAGKTGVSVSHLRVIEVRHGNPTINVFILIAEAFGMDADKLFTGSRQRQPYLTDKDLPE